MLAHIHESDIGFDKTNDMFKVSSMQKKFRDSFGGSAIDAAKWDVVLGTGQTNSVSAGVLTMNSGTTINAESYILSKDVFTVPFKLSIGMTLSQRIANQTFFVEAISVDPITKVPDGKHCAALVFDGTTVTQAKYRVQSSAGTPLDSAAVTIPTTAAGGMYEVEPFGDEVWFHGATLDATTGRANSYRRHQQIPDPNALYKIRLRWLNGGVAPTTTAAAIQYVACQDYAELTAEITSGRGNSVAGQGIYATVAGAVTVSGTAVVTPTAPTVYTLNSAATVNAVNVKATAGTIYSLIVSNINAAARYIKLYNKATAPTVGTDVPILTLAIPASGVLSLDMGALGLKFATGIGIGITTVNTDADATAVAASEIKVALMYI